MVIIVTFVIFFVQDVLWLPPGSWCAFLTGPSTKNLYMSFPYFSVALWLPFDRLTVCEDLLKFIEDDKYKEHPLVEPISSDLKAWIERFQLAARALPQPLLADAGPENRTLTDAEIVAQLELPNANVEETLCAAQVLAESHPPAAEVYLVIFDHCL